MSLVAELPPFYLIVVFWGEKYRRFFETLCLASLLAPGNAPVLAAVRGSKLVVCTTDVDWAAIQASALFCELRNFVEPVFFELGYPSAGANLQLHMSRGHQAGIAMAVRDRAYGMFLAPDLVLSDETMARLVEHARAGKQAVLAPALRYDMDKCVEAWSREGRLVPDRPLVLPARELAGLVANSLHSELQRFEWDSGYYSNYPVSTWFRAAEDGLVFHCSSWAIVLGNFAAVADAVTASLESTTIDAHFVHENFFRFRDEGGLHLVTDSDELIFGSLTSEQDMTFLPLQDNGLRNRPASVREGIKLSDLRAFLFGYESDAFKRWAYTLPCLIHGADIDDAWDGTIDRSRTIVSRAVSVEELPRPLDFVVRFAGERQRYLFEHACLGSLMAPNNLPRVAGIPGCRFVISTTPADREQFSRTWLFIKLQNLIEVVFREAEGAASLTRDTVVLSPDTIYAEGTVERLIELATEGVREVSVPVIEADADGILETMRVSGAIVWHHVLVADRRQLASATLVDSLSTKADVIWDSPLFNPRNGEIHFRHSPEIGVLHTRRWTSLLVRAAEGPVHYSVGSDDLIALTLVAPALVGGVAPGSGHRTWLLRAAPLVVARMALARWRDQEDFRRAYLIQTRAAPSDVVAESARLLDTMLVPVERTDLLRLLASLWRLRAQLYLAELRLRALGRHWLSLRRRLERHFPRLLQSLRDSIVVLLVLARLAKLRLRSR